MESSSGLHDRLAELGGGLGHEPEEGGVRLDQPAGHCAPVDRQHHVDDETRCAGLDTAALDRRCQRISDGGELDQLALGQCRVGGDHSAPAQQELTRAEDLLGGPHRGQQRLDRREVRVGRLELGDEVGLELVAGEENFPLVGEIAVKGALLQTGGARDLRDRGALVSLRFEQLERRALESALRVGFPSRHTHQRTTTEAVITMLMSTTTDAVITDEGLP